MQTCTLHYLSALHAELLLPGRPAGGRARKRLLRQLYLFPRRRIVGVPVDRMPEYLGACKG